MVYFLFTSQARDTNFLYSRESLEHVTSTFILLFQSLANAQHGWQDCLNTTGKVLWLQMMQMFIVSCSCHEYGNYDHLFCILEKLWDSNLQFFSFLRIKLSKLTFNLAECAETFVTFTFVHEPNQWYEIDLEFREVSLQNSLLNILFNSIKLIPQISRHFRQNERFFLRLSVDHSH